MCDKSGFYTIMLGFSLAVARTPSFLQLPDRFTYAVIPRQYTRMKSDNAGMLTVSQPLSPYRESTIDLENVQFIKHTAFGGGRKAAGLGGALLAVRSQVLIHGTNVFQDCVAISGGALVLVQSDTIIRGTKFTSCRAGHTGGAIMATTEAHDRKKGETTQSGTELSQAFQMENFPLVIFSCEFHSCTAREAGGAVSVTASSDLLIEVTNFVECVSGRNGGALTIMDTHAAVVKCLFHKCETGRRNWSVSENHAVYTLQRKEIGTVKLFSGGGAICCGSEASGNAPVGSLVTDCCCFILNECVQNRDEGEDGFLELTAGFDIAISSNYEYTSYRDRFWSWQDLSVTWDASVVKYKSRWYQPGSKTFWSSSTSGCRAFDGVSIEVPTSIGEWKYNDVQTTPQNGIDGGTGFTETSVPANTPVEFVEKPRMTVVQIPTISDFMYRMETHTRWTYKASETFSQSSVLTETAAFSVTSEFHPTNGFSTSNAFVQSFAFTVTDAFKASAPLSQSSVLTETNGFLGTLIFSGSALLSSSDRFIPSNIFDKSESFTASNSFTGTPIFGMTHTFTKSTIFSKSRVFSASALFTKSGTFTPWPTYTEVPHDKSVSISWERLEILDYTASYLHTSHETETETVVEFTGSDGKLTQTVTRTSTAIISYMQINLPTYVLTYKPHRIIIDLTDETNTLSTTVIIGIIVGGGFVIGVAVAFIVWLRRNNSVSVDSDMKSYSISSDSVDRRTGVTNEQLHEFAMDLFNSDDLDSDW